MKYAFRPAESLMNPTLWSADESPSVGKLCLGASIVHVPKHWCLFPSLHLPMLINFQSTVLILPFRNQQDSKFALAGGPKGSVIAQPRVLRGTCADVASICDP